MSEFPRTHPLTPAPHALQWQTVKRDISQRVDQWRNGTGVNFVPDEWIAKAAAIAGLDEASLSYLERNVRARGRVTLQHALFFVKLEDAAQDKRREDAAIASTIKATTRVARADPVPATAPATVATRCHVQPGVSATHATRMAVAA